MESEAGRGITLEKAQKILSDNGVKVSEKQARNLLEFLYKIAILSVKQLRAKKHEKR